MSTRKPRPHSQALPSTSGDIDAMLAAATEVRRHAYVPYSGFPVSACIRGESGRLFVGVNVDNASFPETACAEANAIGAMIAAGDRKVEAVLIVGGRDNDASLCVPCGGCRQRLSEFAAPSAMVYVCGPEGLRQTFEFQQLMPHTFGASQLR